MHEPMWMFIGIALSLGGPWAFYQGFKALRIQQLIRNTPTARVRSMAIGLVEVNGVAIPRSRVSAPFSGRPCVWWGIEVQTLASKSRRSTVRTWNTVHRAASGHPFYLKDETGVALVYPQGADCKVGFDVGEETHGLGVPQMYMDFMESEHLKMRHIWALGSMRFRERRIEEGYGLYVLGRAFPKAVSRVISFDEEALAATGTDSYGANHVRTLDHDVCALIRRGPRDPAFILSTTSERMEAIKYGFKGFAGLIGGPLMTVSGLWIVLELLKFGR